MFDLRHEPWIPWQLRSGRVEWGPPAALVSHVGAQDPDPVVAIAAPRPDLAGALEEFLIGLLTVALLPDDEAAWRDWSAHPPTREQLQQALEALPAAFDLDGDGPRFLQDHSAADLADGAVRPIDVLLIDAPGEQGIALNKGFFVRPGRVQRLGRPAAAMALITMQTYAPAGGQGHRTSLRGGGPLTTLVDPRSPDGLRSEPLWTRLWANVETREQWSARAPGGSPADPPSIYPWLAPTRVSDPKRGGQSTTPADAHPLQAYFGMPRRIRLEFGDAGTCDLVGTTDERTVVGFRTLNFGTQYVGWRHPLSPHNRQREGDPFLPVHGQPGGLTWRDWLALTYGMKGTSLREPAGAVAHYVERRAGRAGQRALRVHAFGFDMDSMKARGWTEATIPAYVIADAAEREDLRAAAAAFVEATGIAASALLGAVKGALFPGAESVAGDLGQVRLDLWAATEEMFAAQLRTMAEPLATDEERAARRDELRLAWARTLERETLQVFDRWVPASAMPTADLQRRVRARFQLASVLRGHSKAGGQLFTALGISPPGGGRRASAAKSPARKKERPA